ncbi:MAG: hypothetical protein IPK66_01850 [Rhodospirillales bacterium]|nr:hypothetical protein [Rhodospirillales bacterium]
MDTTLRMLRLPVLAFSLLSFGLMACSETWEGVKEDTKDNVETTGQGIEKAGENIKKQAE